MVYIILQMFRYVFPRSIFQKISAGHGRFCLGVDALPGRPTIGQLHLGHRSYRWMTLVDALLVKRRMSFGERREVHLVPQLVVHLGVCPLSLHCSTHVKKCPYFQT